MNSVDKIHVWEAAGLGKAPYTYIGYKKLEFQAAPGEPVRAGGTCNYCPAAIMDSFWFRSSDGKEFKVGSTCVNRSGDKGLISAIKQEVNRIKTEKRNAREAKRIADFLKWWNHSEQSPTVVEAMLKLPHPLKWKADSGENRVDWLKWMFANAGNKGKIETLRWVYQFAEVDEKEIRKELTQ